MYPELSLSKYANARARLSSFSILAVDSVAAMNSS